MSKKAENFAILLKRLVTSTFPTVEFYVAFKAPNEIGKYFPFEDNIKSTGNKSGVVYKLRCNHCDATYIGKTHLHLSERVKEHQKCEKSAVFQHGQTHKGHEIAFDRVEVIDSSDSKIKLAAKEALHILKEKPSLNKQLNSQSGFDLKMLIIAAHSAQC